MITLRDSINHIFQIEHRKQIKDNRTHNQIYIVKSATGSLLKLLCSDVPFSHTIQSFLRSAKCVRLQQNISRKKIRFSRVVFLMLLKYQPLI